MALRNLPHYARALAAFEPELIHGYPSSVALVAGAVLDAGLTLRPRAVITASETLLPHQRKIIREAFAVEPRVWYGNTEFAGNIVECPEGRLHVREEHSYVEVLDDQDQPVSPGRAGRLVATAFMNEAMFLVRYDTGDIVISSRAEQCECGRGGRLIDHIVGRVEEYIVDADGRLIGRLDHLFKDAHGVREAQLEQREIGVLIVRLVVDAAPGPEIERPIREEAARRLSPDTKLVFEYVKDLPKTSSGKSHFVISRVRTGFGPYAQLFGTSSASPTDDSVSPEKKPTPPAGASPNRP
jgi:phenylacetate-CoA ligase